MKYAELTHLEETGRWAVGMVLRALPLHAIPKEALDLEQMGIKKYFATQHSLETHVNAVMSLYCRYGAVSQVKNVFDNVLRLLVSEGVGLKPMVWSNEVNAYELGSAPKWYAQLVGQSAGRRKDCAPGQSELADGASDSGRKVVFAGQTSAQPIEVKVNAAGLHQLLSLLDRILEPPHAGQRVTSALMTEHWTETVRSELRDVFKKKIDWAFLQLLQIECGGDGPLEKLSLFNTLEHEKYPMNGLQLVLRSLLEDAVTQNPFAMGAEDSDRPNFLAEVFPRVEAGSTDPWYYSAIRQNPDQNRVVSIDDAPAIGSVARILSNLMIAYQSHLTLSPELIHLAQRVQMLGTVQQLGNSWEVRDKFHQHVMKAWCDLGASLKSDSKRASDISAIANTLAMIIVFHAAGSTTASGETHYNKKRCQEDLKRAEERGYHCLLVHNTWNISQLPFVRARDTRRSHTMFGGLYRPVKDDRTLEVDVEETSLDTETRGQKGHTGHVQGGM